MKYCEICRKNNNWPTAMQKSHENCEICGAMTTVYYKDNKYLHSVEKFL